MKTTRLVIKDQVNVKFEGLEQSTRVKINEALKFMLPYARHTPKFKLKRWDGKISFATIGGSTFLNLLEIVLPFVINDGYEIEIVDKRPLKTFDFKQIDEYYLSDKKWEEGHIFEGEPVILMEHQVNAVNHFLKNEQSIECLATSAGKTIISACLAKAVEEASGGRTLLIVPSIQLVRQTEKDFINLDLDVGVYFGEEKNYNNKHIITTWQSMVFLSKAAKEDKEAKQRLEALLYNVDAVMVDETHILKGTEIRELLCNTLAHIPLRWGFTGTIPKDDCDFICLVAALGQVVYTVTAKELQDSGLISKCHIHAIKTNDNHVEFDNYESETEFINSDRDRVNWIADYCKEITKSGNTLVLVNNIALGKKLCEMTPNSFFIYGNVDNDKRIEEFKKLATENNLTIYATFQTCSTGISAVRIFNMVLVNSQKSFTRAIQTIGRILRKGGDKDFGNIYDVYSSLKFAARHYSIRKKYYQEAQYPITETKIDYR